MSPARSALIVASYEFRDPGLRRLRAPAKDAEALAEVLGDPEIGGYSVSTVLNRPSYEIDRAVESFFADRSPDDLLLVHYSGHGVKDENGDLYFAATDTDLKLLGATAVSADFVNRLMARTRSRSVVLFLDCCYAGAFGRGLATRGDTDMHIAERLGGRGRAVITASTAMEYAFEGSDVTDVSGVQPSVFTSALVGALRTGDADTDQDGYIGLDELYDYVYDRVRSVTPSQTPSKWTLGLQGDLHLARRKAPVTTPAPLPAGLADAVDSPFAGVREGAVQELARYLHGSHAGLALAARVALERLRDDDSRSVAGAAAAALAAGPGTAALPPHPGRAAEPDHGGGRGPDDGHGGPAAGADAHGEAGAEAGGPADAVTDDAGAAPALPVTPEPSPHPRDRRRVVLAAGLGGGLLVVAGGVWAALAGGGGDNGGGGDSGAASTGGGGSSVLADSEMVVPIQADASRGPELWVVDAVTGKSRTLPTTQPPRLPTISPDRSTVVYVTGPHDEATLRAVDADGTDDRRFLNRSSSRCGHAGRPAFSPDGSIVVVCTDGADKRLILLDDTAKFVEYLPTQGVPDSPTWAESDGQQVVVYMRSDKTGGPTTLWGIDPEAPGSGELPVTDPGSESDSHPDFDPSSQTLLFLRAAKPGEKDGTVIEKTERDPGAGETPVPGLTGVGSPTWSRDGSAIAYVKDGRLWTVGADGSDPRSINLGTAVPGAPAWGSR